MIGAATQDIPLYISVKYLKLRFFTLNLYDAIDFDFFFNSTKKNQIRYGLQVYTFIHGEVSQDKGGEFKRTRRGKR